MMITQFTVEIQTNPDEYTLPKELPEAIQKATQGSIIKELSKDDPVHGGNFSVVVYPTLPTLPMELSQWLDENGTDGFNLLVGEYIRRAPSFPGDEELAREIGTKLALLKEGMETAARTIQRFKKVMTS